MSQFYTTIEVEQIEEYTSNIFILADGSDERASTMAKKLSTSVNHIEKILLLKYHEEGFIQMDELFPEAEIIIFNITSRPSDFLGELIKFKEFLVAENVLIDITCIHVPEMFTLLKYFKITNKKKSIDVTYSIPFEYEFSSEPFTSYRSYYGNLKTNDLLGFGGISEGVAHSKMIVFLGFEGVLSSKVTEDIQYDNLLLVNNLPSFFPKYKDICVINNYDLLTSRYSKLVYVPADNPFETYNFLEAVLQDDEQACVAPLSTKLVALGVCLYAMEHANLRVVYPMSEEYTVHSTNNVLHTFLYKILLSDSG